MERDEFIRLLRVSRNGGRQDVGGAASELLELVRRCTAAYLRKKNAVIAGDIVDDLAHAVLVDLFRAKKVPDYSWKTWLFYLIRKAWRVYRRSSFLPDTLSLDAAEHYQPKETDLPVPIEANGRLLAKNGERILLKRALRDAPGRGPERDVWLWTVRLLIETGNILKPEFAACRAVIPVEECRRVILRAVLSVRLSFEDLFGDEGIHAAEECSTASDLAQRIF